MSKEVLKKYNTEIDKPIIPKFTDYKGPTTRLGRIVKRVPFSEITDFDNCWYCQEDKKYKLSYCKRCYFYIQNQFNDLMYD